MFGAAMTMDFLHHHLLTDGLPFSYLWLLVLAPWLAFLFPLAFPEKKTRSMLSTLFGFFFLCVLGVNGHLVMPKSMP